MRKAPRQRKSSVKPHRKPSAASRKPESSATVVVFAGKDESQEDITKRLRAFVRKNHMKVPSNSRLKVLDSRIGANSALRQYVIKMSQL